MKIEDLRTHMDSRFDKLDDKLDVVAGKTTENSTDVSWLKGHVKFTTVIFSTLFTGLLLYLLTGS